MSDKMGEFRCSCGRKLAYIRMDGIGRCHICGLVSKEEVDRQRNAWREKQILNQRDN